MAIINSTAIGASRKTAGELSYRRVRGRTIGSRRITENKSNTQFQKDQRQLFGLFGKVARLFSSFLDLSFDKTKYGSARNNFMKQNIPSFVEYSRVEPVGNPGEGDSIIEYFIGIAASAGSPVLMGNGSNMVNASYSLEEKAATINIVTTEPVAVGDKIVMMFACSYAMAGVSQMFDSVRTYEVEVTNELYSSLDNKQVFELDSSNVPVLADPYVLPVGATLDLDVAAVTLLKMNGSQVSMRSYCQLLNLASYGKTYTLSNPVKTGNYTFTVVVNGETDASRFNGATIGVYNQGSPEVANITNASASGGNVTLTCEAVNQSGPMIGDMSLQEVESYIKLSNGSRDTTTNRVSWEGEI